jgi:hypothetical protein
MHAFLISGRTPQARQLIIDRLCAEWLINPIDILVLDTEERSLGIADVRTFTKDLSVMPRQSAHVIGVIPQGDLLTIEAQQALLKTLEEPPPHAKIIIGISQEQHLLPTILSRCQVMRSQDANDGYEPKELDECWRFIQQLRTATPGNRVSALASIGKTKDDFAAFIPKAIASVATHLVSEGQGTHKWTAAIGHGLIEAMQLSSNNVHPQLLLERIFLADRE